MEQDILSHNSLDQPALFQLKEISKWGRFLSITGFVFCGFFVILAFFAGSIFSALLSNAGNQSGAANISGIGFGLTFIYLFYTAIFFIPCLLLFQASSKLRTAVDANEPAMLTEGFTKLKAYFRFWGIITIIGLAFMVIGMLFGGLGALTTIR